MGNVVTLQTLDSSVVSLIILVFIFVSSYKRSDKLFPAHNMFIALVLINIALLIIDYLAWAFNGLPGRAYMILNAGFNCLLYVAAPAAPITWLFYLHYQVFGGEESVKTLKPVMTALFALNAALAIASLFTGWYYTIDAHNVYSRGPLFAAHLAYTGAMILYAALLVLRNRRTIEKRYFYTLLLFFVPPAVGMLLQAFIYGVSYNWVGMALSVLIIFLNIQNRSLNTDYLTGAYNRRQLEGYTKSKARGEGNMFGAIMLDLDRFKEINDTYGHDAGDEALKDAVAIVRASIRENDFVARVGGDEFVVILDMQDERDLEAAKERIEKGVAEFNDRSARPYRISFSYGHSIYDVKSGLHLDDFFKRIDTLMYRDKNEKKERENQD